jgi:hypothetical protein
MRKLIFALSLVSFAIAQDPPSRAARLSYINGTVSFQPGGVDDWVPAEPNRPMTTGDRLWTDEGSRAEMNLGSAAFRLNSRTNFTFLNLDDKTAQVQLSLGTLNVRLRSLAPDEIMEIDTPQVAFTLLRPGDYRVEVNEQGDATIVTVRGGDAEATANGQTLPVQAREQVRITAAEGSDPVLDRRAVPPADSFDNFCQDRDRRDDLSQSAKYVSRDAPGGSDLDANGTWRNDPQYGPVWAPNTVPVGWSPYHYGHWAWIAPWGWTWIDDAQWGYVPFHFGRWAFAAGTWVWVPGPLGVRPVYAPAMVVFAGGPGFGVGVVGWFPLGPREVFVPTYSVSAAYVTRVNVTNTVVTEVAIRNGGADVVYANQRVPGAIVAVRGDAMVGGRRIDAAMAVRIPPGAVEHMEVLHAAPVAPERAAVLGGRAPLTVHLPPSAVMNRPVVTKTTPPSSIHANTRSSGVAVKATSPAPALRQEARPEAAASRTSPVAQERERKKTSRAAKKTTKSEKEK